MRLLFWGTPEFAVPSLRALVGEGFDVVGVVTRPDRAQGRSRSRLIPSAVKQAALAEGLTVLQPERPRGLEFVDTLRLLSPDLSVVVAYGHILVSEVIDLPPMGTINVHASLLPSLRGAAPIQAAILDGRLETGITIMRIVPALDAGPILLQIATPIASDETLGELQLRLSELGAQALIESLALLELKAAVERQQDDALATYAPKVDRAATRIDWSQPAATVARVIRAYDPRPGASTSLGDTALKIFGAHLAAEPLTAPVSHELAPGTIAAIDAAGCVIACGTGAVRVTQVQPAGRQRMAPAEWARGRGVTVGDRLQS
jgi:methionyl-tRNA formyltransferase